MEALRNPFAPGAGSPPPELAGRDDLIEEVMLKIKRIGYGFPEKSSMLIGLRGVGKTVLLERIRRISEDAEFKTLIMEISTEGKSLPALLAPRLKTLLLKLSTVERAKELTQRALKYLAGFAKTFKVKYNDIEIGLDVAPEPGLADSGDFDLDLQSLMTAVGEAARAANSAAVFLIDELQYVKPRELEALIMALHFVGQRTLPVTIVGAGLPQLRGNLGNAKTYAERLFSFKVVGPLSREATFAAIRNPVVKNGVDIEEEALGEIYAQTQGYPYFIQEWGNHVWCAAQNSPITRVDVQTASRTAQAALDESFFGVRFDKLTPYEKKYLRAMADLGDDSCRSEEIIEKFGEKIKRLFTFVPDSLINKGMIYSPEYGITAFTVPLFGSFMRRIMPENGWNSGGNGEALP